MYDVFRTGKQININACCKEFDISVSTFRRYMAFLREYFHNVHAQEIVYDPVKTEYKLSKKV